MFVGIFINMINIKRSEETKQKMKEAQIKRYSNKII